MRKEEYRKLCVSSKGVTPTHYDRAIDYVLSHDAHISAVNGTEKRDALAADAVNSVIVQAVANRSFCVMGVIGAAYVHGIGGVRLFVSLESADQEPKHVWGGASVRLIFRPESNKDGVLLGTLNFWNRTEGDSSCKVSVQKNQISFAPMNEGEVLPHFMGDERINKMANDMVRVYFDSQTNGTTFLWFTK